MPSTLWSADPAVTVLLALAVIGCLLRRTKEDLLFMALLLPRGWLRGACLGFAAVMGLTRIALGEHYPLDALAGAFIGGATALAVIQWWVLPRLRRLESEATPQAPDGPFGVPPSGGSVRLESEATPPSA